MFSAAVRLSRSLHSVERRVRDAYVGWSVVWLQFAGLEVREAVFFVDIPCCLLGICYSLSVCVCVCVCVCGATESVTAVYSLPSTVLLNRA